MFSFQHDSLDVLEISSDQNHLISMSRLIACKNDVFWTETRNGATITYDDVFLNRQLAWNFRRPQTPLAEQNCVLLQVISSTLLFAYVTDEFRPMTSVTISFC